MKQANLFSFFKKPAGQNNTTAAAAAAPPAALPAASINQNVPARCEKKNANQQQQPPEATTVQRAVEEIEAQPQLQPEVKIEADHAIVDNESKEQPPPVIPQSLGRSSSSRCNSSSNSSASATGTIINSTVLTNGGVQMSDYERIREENIRRNQAFLMSLGLAGPDAMKPMAQTTARPGV